MRPFAAFLIVTIVGIAVAWSGGFNFDQRTPDVAFGVLCLLVVSLFAASITKEST